MRSYASLQVSSFMSLKICSNLVDYVRNFSRSSMPMIHQKCRIIEYPRTNGSVKRFPVPDDKVPWSAVLENYEPSYFTSEQILSRSWADPEIGDTFHPLWNSVDGEIDRKSHNKEYQVKDNYPLNPCGRTGLRGRGVLGKWGPNHAADPIVTRWKRDRDGRVLHHPSKGRPVLQFVGIKRRDCHEWAIPGGMVDPGETISMTLKREFLEEALNSLEMTEKNKETANKMLETFSSGSEIYKGYVDDPRNTDNAWIETVVHNFHDDTGSVLGNLPLNAGDDAIGVKWLDISRDLPLYASHSHFIELVAKKHDSYW